jgi:Raf kinase inhibitor-like YbhB/YbcL family protein
VVVVVSAACSSSPSGSGAAEHLAGEEPSGATAITVTSDAFGDGGAIPEKYSCDGQNVSPPLAWSGVPEGAAELALVVDDPDAPGGTFVHWVLFGIDPATTNLDEADVPAGARQAKNSSGDAEYKGPCPPGGDGAHHYRFTVYALDTQLEAADGSAASEVLDAIGGAIAGRGTLTGTFQR